MELLLSVLMYLGWGRRHVLYTLVHLDWMLSIKEPLFPSALAPGKNSFNYFNGYYGRSNFGNSFVTHALVSFSTHLYKF